MWISVDFWGPVCGLFILAERQHWVDGRTNKTRKRASERASKRRTDGADIDPTTNGIGRTELR